MKFVKTITAATLLTVTGAAQAELSANIATVSNYLWRGVTQSNDKAAVQGGIDYNHDSGAYVGTWLSNVNYDGDPEDTNGDGNLDTNNTSKANAEVDFYAGFGSDIGDTGLSYDVGTIYYFYPGAGDGNDFAEVNGSLGFGPVTGTVAYTIWDEDTAGPLHSGDIYYSANLDLPFEFEGFTSSMFIGYYDFDKDGENNVDLNYTNWGIGINKDAGDFGSFSFNYAQTDEDDAYSTDKDPNFWVGWSKGF